MKIGILSDTRDHFVNLKKALKIFKAEKIKLLLHCGDWVSASILEYFDFLNRDFQVPVKSVFGNNEGAIQRIIERNYRLKKPIEFAPNQVLEFKVKKKKVAMYHGQDDAITKVLIQSGLYDVVFTGHTHRPLIKQVKKTLHVNPGTLSFDREGRFNKEHTVAIYKPSLNQAQIIHL